MVKVLVGMVIRELDGVLKTLFRLYIISKYRQI